MSWWSCTSDRHDRCSQKSKAQATANPVHCFSIWHTSLVTYHRCKPLIKSCCSSTHATCWWHYQWCECGMFNFVYMLFILPFLFCSCLLYTDARGPCWFDWALELNTLTSRNAFSNLPPQKPYTAMSKWAPSSVIAEWCDIVSPESDCRWSSVVTPWQTSDSNEAVMSLTSLWETSQQGTDQFCNLRHAQHWMGGCNYNERVNSEA